MRARQRSPLLEVIRKISGKHCDQQASDRELLIRFVETRDQDAFTALVRRHGSMVLGVGLRVLRHHQDAEDVCQATFLLLAKKANATAWRDSVANWLYQTAYHLSFKARQTATRRNAQERKVEPKTPPDPLAEITARELQSVLDEELSRLPTKYRSPLLLCCLEGKTRDEAARFLGVPLSTVISRLEKGRELLRRRLAGRGVPFALALAGGTLLSETVRATVPWTLARATSQAALQVMTGAVLNNVVSANVAALIKGGMKTMFLTQLKTATTGVLVAGLLVAGALIGGMNVLPETAAAPPATENKDEPLAARGPREKDGNDAKPAEQETVKTVKADDVVKDGKHVHSLAYCNGGNTVAVLIWKHLPQVDTQPSSVVLWNLKTGKVEHTLEKFDEGGMIFDSVTASKDGTTVAAVSSGIKDATIKVWDAKTGKSVQTLTSDGIGVNRIALSPDGKRAVGCARLNSAFVWDVATGKLLNTLETKDMTFWSVAISEDGKFAAAGGEVGIGKLTGEGQVVVWEVESGKVKHELTDAKMSTAGSLAFSPDGKMIAAASANEGTIRMWDMNTGELKRQLKGHSVNGFAFSPDGKRLASAGFDDRTVVVWDVAQEKALEKFEGHTEHSKGGFLSSVSFAPNGRTVASGSWDGTMRFWPVTQPKK